MRKKQTEMRSTAFKLALAAALGIALGLVEYQIAHAEQSSDARVMDLVRAGKIRAGVGVVAPHWAVKDPATGELRGLAIDLGRALASRIGVALVPVEYPSPPRVLDGLSTNAWDVGFLGVDPSRAAVVDFSPPYLQIEATFLVPASSSIRKIEDADQSGVRIAVTRNSVEQLVLTPMLKRAELLPVETIAAGFDVVSAGKAEVFAAPRPTLIQISTRLPGSRVLEDRFHATLGAMAVPKGQAERLSYISEFIAEAKKSGLVQQAIEHAGLRGVQVAP